MKLLFKLIGDAILITLLLFIGYINKWGNLQTLSHTDIGTILTLAGWIWVLGGFISLSTSFDHWIASISCGILLIIFGCSLSLWGLFHAMLYLGIGIIIIAYLLSGFMPEFSTIIVILGVALIIFGYSFRDLSIPTQIPEKPLPPPFSDEAIKQRRYPPPKGLLM